MHFQPRHHRHEVSILKLRQERKNEAQTIEKIKRTLETKLQIKPTVAADKLTIPQVA